MSHAHDEIFGQAAAWRSSLEGTFEQWTLLSRSVQIDASTQFLLVGSGSSLHIALTAAHCIQELTSRVARAVASSEVFLSSASTVPTTVPVIAFVISRSGETTEALIAAEYLRECFKNVTVVAVTCNSSTSLEDRSHHAIAIPEAAERSVVMTRSFTSMLLALQVVGAMTARDDGVLAELRSLPGVLEERMPDFDRFGRLVGVAPAEDQYIYLGLGANEGLAKEGTLKLKEMTQTASEAYNPLEFRHGPISIVRPGTTAIILEGEREHRYMADLESDLRGHGARVAVIAPHAPATAELSVRLPEGLSDVARCALYVPPLQLIAYHRTLAAHLDPDQPRNLTQVVVLETDGDEAKHARQK
jgi:glucosamine--fructose-6-phosphate aminotransferase (isomerizing)